MQELICICCPMGCRLTVEKVGEEYKVSGNTCPRGVKYAIEELTAPTRVVTSSIPVIKGNCDMVSVKTDKPIAKNLIFESLKKLSEVKATAPVKIGDVVLENVLETGVNFIATRNVDEK